MGGWRQGMAGGVAAALLALFLLVSASVSHAMPASCGSLHGSTLETSHHSGHHGHTGEDRQKIASCAMACSLCLSVLSEPGFNEHAAAGHKSPLPSTAAFMTGLAPAPDLGPPRTSA